MVTRFRRPVPPATKPNPSKQQRTEPHPGQAPQEPPVSKVVLPRRGRGEEFHLELLGKMVETPSGQSFLDVSDYRGHDINFVLRSAQRVGLQDADPAELLAMGVNAYIERAARGIGQPTLADKILAEGLAQDAGEAKIMAMHLGSVIKRRGGSDEDAIEFLKRFGSDVESEEDETGEVEPHQ